MNNSASQEKRKYGLLSMISMVVGIVLGSGFFFVNTSLYKATNSTAISIFGWIFISIFVLFVLISFIEISSSTKIKNIPGTVNNWNHIFWNKNFSKIISSFMVFIYLPILISGLGFLGGNQFYDFLKEVSSNSVIRIGKLNEAWTKYLIVLLFSFVLLIFFFLLNTFTRKPSDLFQKFGTFFKMIPLLLILLLGFLVFLNVSFGGDVNNIDEIFDKNSELNVGWKENTFLKNFENVLIISPTIMFSFDGFVYSAALQNEAKDDKTYKRSLIIGIIFLIVIYFSSSVFSFALGSNGDFSIPTAISNIFGESSSKYIVPIVYFIIFVSILSVISGMTIFINRNIADASISGVVPDPKGKLIRRNKAMTPQNSSFLAFFITVMFFILISFLNAGMVAGEIKSSTNPEELYKVSVITFTGITLNINTLLIFTVYSLIIIGAFKNRFTNKVEVEKNSFFIPSSIISIFIIFIVLVFYSISLFQYKPLESYISKFNYDLQYISSLVYVFSIFISTISINFYLSFKDKKTSKEDLIEKDKLIKSYLEQRVDPKFLKK